MSISSAITTARSRVAAAYTACNNKGATMPASGSQNLSNLATTINSIETPIPVNQAIEKVVKTTSGSTETYTRVREVVGSITEITSNKYQNDTNLISALIPDTITTIDSGAFDGCSNLEYINLRNITTIYSYYAFRNTTSLYINLKLPKLTNAGGGVSAFSGSGIIKISNLGNITSVPESFAFGCQLLSEIDLSSNSSITTIMGSAFRACPKLKSVILPTSVTSLRSYAFGFPNQAGACPALESISGLNNVTAIGDRVFGCDVSLKIEVSLPKLESMTSEAFADSGITKVNSLGKITTVANGAFNSCPNLTSVTLPTTVTAINSYAFYNCTALTSISGLSNVKTVSTGAFQSASLLNMEISLPSLTTISANAFGSTNIKKVINLGSIIELPQAFHGCKNLVSVVLPSTITSIASYAFQADSSLTTITVLATTPPSITANTFAIMTTLTTIYVPSASVNTYKTATNWSAYASKIQAIS